MLVRPFSHAVISQLSGSNRRLSLGSLEAVIWQSSSIHETFISKITGGLLAIISHSLRLCSVTFKQIHPELLYVCFPLLLFLKSEMFPSRRRHHLTAICPMDTYGSHFGLTWLSPKNIVYYCPGCSKSFAIVGSIKNLLSCSGTHSKGLPRAPTVANPIQGDRIREMQSPRFGCIVG